MFPCAWELVLRCSLLVLFVVDLILVGFVLSVCVICVSSDCWECGFRMLIAFVVVVMILCV